MRNRNRNRVRRMRRRVVKMILHLMLWVWVRALCRCPLLWRSSALQRASLSTEKKPIEKNELGKRKRIGKMKIRRKEMGGSKWLIVPYSLFLVPYSHCVEQSSIPRLFYIFHYYPNCNTTFYDVKWNLCSWSFAVISTCSTESQTLAINDNVKWKFIERKNKI